MVSRNFKFKAYAWLICSLGALFYCYEYFLRISPSVMTPELMKTYHLTGAEVGNLSAFYYHAYVPMQIIVGLLMDRYGPRRLTTIACICCAVGTYLFAGTHSIAIAQFGRFLVGMGSAFAFVGALKLATIWLPPNRFALVSGIIMCLGMTGAMIGDILLQDLVFRLGWMTTIYVSAGAGFVLSILLWTCLNDKNSRYVYQSHENLSFKELMLGLWISLKNLQIWKVGIIGMLLYLSLSAFGELWGIPYLEQAHGLTRHQAATANSMIFLGWAIGSPCWGLLSDFLSRRCVPIAIGAIGALICACVLLYVPAIPFLFLCVLQLLFGLLASAQILIFAICRESTPMRFAGTAIALTNMIVMVGGNIFQPMIGKLLDLSWAGIIINGARVYRISNYQAALSLIPIGILIAFILIFFVRETRCEVYD